MIWDRGCLMASVKRTYCLERLEETLLEECLRLEGYTWDTSSEKGPATKPNNDYEWLGYRSTFDGPAGRFSVVNTDTMESLRAAHRWAFGEVRLPASFADFLRRYGWAETKEPCPTCGARGVVTLPHDDNWINVCLLCQG